MPPLYAAEMTPFDPLVGEFRVHYAGFFDPGFGHSAAGGTGSRAVLEVRSHEVPFILEHGQIVGRLVYEHMMARPSASTAATSLQLPGPGPEAVEAFSLTAPAPPPGMHCASGRSRAVSREDRSGAGRAGSEAAGFPCSRRLSYGRISCSQRAVRRTPSLMSTRFGPAIASIGRVSNR